MGRDGRKGRWKETLIRVAGTSLLGGATAGDWLDSLAAARFAVGPRSFLNAAMISAGSVANSVLRSLEERRFGPLYREVPVAPPLFVLGHWRSGTTHLHNLLARDPRFSFPNLYQVMFPHTFLVTEGRLARWMKKLLPRTRFSLDNVKFGWDVPHEDEFVTAASLLSPYLSLAFPRRMRHFDRFLTFREAAPAEVARWKEALTLFLRKVSWKSPRPLLLKSPPHTARIRLLLEAFPGARFVHIRRDPFAVYRSMARMLEVARRFWLLQGDRGVEWNERMLRQYREMHEAYFEERRLIPDGHFHEMGFEDLEEDPLREMGKLYEALHLPDFGAVEPRLRAYLASLAGYRKNEFPEIDADTRSRVAREWCACFDAWGYPT